MFTVWFAGLISFLIALYLFRERTTNLVYNLVHPISEKLAHRIKDILERFLLGLRMFKKPRHFIEFFVLSTLYWLSSGFGLYILARGFHIQIPVVAAFAMMSMVVIGMMIPNSPANIGSFWYFLVLPLTAYSVSPDAPNVVMYSLAVWTIQLIQLTLFGGYFLALGKINVAGFLFRQKQTEDPVET